MDCTLRIGDLKPDRQSPPGDLVDDWLKDRAALSTWPGHPRCRAVLELVIGKRMSVGAGARMKQRSTWSRVVRLQRRFVREPAACAGGRRTILREATQCASLPCNRESSLQPRSPVGEAL
jgi:hypothetical protein